MADYTKITDFAVKDSLLTGNPLKLITGTAHDNEYNAIAVAIATKVDESGGTLTNGTLVNPALGTPASGILTNCTGTASGLTAGGNALLAGSASQAFSTAALTTTGLFDISGASAGQIKFPATQNPSADVNTLDDYEEGTWTPAITFATAGDLSVAYTLQIGRYIKIGSSVEVVFNIITSSFTHSTASGNLRITGLPFTNDVYGNRGSIDFGGINKAGYSQINCGTPSSLAYLQLVASGMGVAAATITSADVPTGGSVTLFGTVTFSV